MVYLITYDLNKPGQNYKELFEEIKKLGESLHVLDSTWLVDTRLNAEAISSRLRTKFDTNDHILVVSFGDDHQGWLSKSSWDWIRNHHVSHCA